MKRRLIQGLLVVALLCGAMLLTHPTAAWALDGNGTQEAPYRISSAADLQAFAAKVNGGNTAACAVLMGDINLNGTESDQWTPIGNVNNKYIGTFDGNNKTIKGLNIDSDAEYVGLFGYIGEGGSVKNLTLADSSINSRSSGDCAYVGGICGYNWGTITNCSNSGSVAYTGSGAEDGNEIGGICGQNCGSITTCSNSGKIVSNGNTSNGNTSDVGGICGLNWGTITNCCNSGDVSVSGVNAYSGGICGYNWSSITTCSNSGKVTGSTGSGSRNSVGGVCGWNYAGFITTCSNSGEVSGNSVGGICGVNDGGSITNCSNSGDVTGSGDSSTVSGICGQNNRSITNCYWLSGTADAGIGDDSGTVEKVESKTEDEYKSGEVAWLLNGESTNGPWRQNLTGTNRDAFPTLDQTHHIVIGENNTYTNDEHKYQNGFCTCGSYEAATQDDAGTYQISNAGQLYWFAELVNGGQTTANAVLTMDITINSNVLDKNGELNGDGSDFIPWTPIGDDSKPYTGTFDGAGFSICGVVVERTESMVGFFRSIGENGVVKNLTLADGYIRQGDSNIGGICGVNDGTITGCTNSSSVVGYSLQIGGICGYNGGLISECVNEGVIRSEGAFCIGGICGGNSEGTVERCINNGAVISTGTYMENTGGICGHLFSGSSSIENCRNSGPVSATFNNASVGGICGDNASGIAHCSNDGLVSGSGEQALVGGICGSNDGRLTDSYCLDTTCESAIGVTSEWGETFNTGAKTAAQYASGEVAWLLNQGQTDGPWRQNLNDPDKDAAPILDSTHKVVVQLIFNANTGNTADNRYQYANSGDTVTVPEAPTRSGYTFGGWYDNDALSGDPVTEISAEATGDQTYWAKWTAKQTPPPTIPPTVSEETIDAIADAAPGETVTVDLSSGSTTLDKEVFETLAGKDVTLVVDLGDGVSWTVNGMDIPEDTDFTDLDLGVTMNSDGIPVDVVNAITGEHGSVQVTLAHNGAFGFTMTLTAPLGEENAGLWANLYHFDEDAGKMTFETAAQIGSDGSVSLAFNHASQYAIVIDDHNHGVVTLPFTDVRDSDWFYNPVVYVYSQGLMTGTSADTFEPNTSLSRAMLVAVLHRLEGSPAVSTGDFTDVADGDWYAQAVNWAASVGVVNGFDDGTFQPNTAITREQLAAILRNYAAYKGLDVSTSGDLSTYTDAGSVSDWAKESVEWAVGQGLLSGMTVDTLQPQGVSTRAQVAAVLQRYLAN